MTKPNFASRTLWTGDNLDVLRGMNSDCVDLIYLDPPFNSNRNYAAPIGSKAAGAAFKDTWTLSDLDVAWMGLVADVHPAMYRVIEPFTLKLAYSHCNRSGRRGTASPRPSGASASASTSLIPCQPNAKV